MNFHNRSVRLLAEDFAMSRPLSDISRFAAALVALTLAAVAPPFGQTPPERRSWRDYGGGPDNARFSTLNQITKANVAALRPVWTYPTSDTASYVFGPLVVDNVAYVLA